MTQYIDKSAIKAEIERMIKHYNVSAKEFGDEGYNDNVLMEQCKANACKHILSFIDTLEVIDPYKQCIQYPSVKDGIEAHAETYSFNIESLLFNQLTKEQQALWRKEIEQAVISGGEVGVELARDPRYEENLKTKDALIEKACEWLKDCLDNGMWIANDVGCAEKEVIIEYFQNYMKENNHGTVR